MKKLAIIILFILNTVNALSQVKDTVYIYFDSTNVEMKKGSFKTFKSVKYPNENIKISYSYKIGEKKHEYSYLYDSGYTFTHYNLGKFDLDRGGHQPLVLVKDTCFLKTIKLLNIDYFLTTDYHDVCKIFEKEDSWEQDVVIFIIDKDEIKDGKLILREVTFSRPVKE